MTDAPKKRGRKPGYVMPEDVKQKISTANKGRPHTAESSEAMRAVWARRKAAGYTVSDETREKMSAAKKGRPLTEEHKQALKHAKKLQFGGPRK